jgi:hypothetical protein
MNIAANNGIKVEVCSGCDALPAMIANARAANGVVDSADVNSLREVVNGPR